MWRDMGFGDAVPMLIEILKSSDYFWAGQNLRTNWWNSNVGSAETKNRRQVYGEVYYSVCALRKLRDQRAKEVLLLTRNRWQSIAFDNPQILEECEVALKELAEVDRTHKQPSESTR